MLLSIWNGHDLAERQPALHLAAVGALQLDDLGQLALEETGLSATRGTLTSFPGIGVSPAISNSSTSARGHGRPVAFICLARSMVARFQTNSPVSWMLATLSFRKSRQSR